MANRLRKPSESDADIDRAKNRRPMHTDLRCDDVIAGIASPIVEAMQAKPDQREPMDDADPRVFGDGAQPVEAEKLGGIRHG
jgi:hypothetical protein